MNKKSFILATTGITEMKNAITAAGKDLTDLIEAFALLVSGLTSAVSGLVLLIMCAKTAFKAKGGNSGAWDEAAETIATCVIVLCFSAAIFAAFF